MTECRLHWLRAWLSVLRGVPRLPADCLRSTSAVTPSTRWQHRTQRSFGYQWMRFGELRPEFEDQFLWFISHRSLEASLWVSEGSMLAAASGVTCIWAARWGQR